MRRFLVEGPLKRRSVVRLSAEESRHALRSLRLAPGDRLLLTDGKGREAEGSLRTTDPEGAEVEVLQVKETSRASSLELLQAPLKGPKMDWLVEKITELGVSRLHLAHTRHTVAKGEKIDRWQRIAESAVKQSGNPVLPEILAPLPLPEVMEKLGDGFRILLEPGASEGLHSLIRKRPRGVPVVLAVGPEGGFSPEEAEALKQAGFRPASLSNQTLRGETAALAAVAIAAHSIDF